MYWLVGRLPLLRDEVLLSALGDRLRLGISLLLEKLGVLEIERDLLIPSPPITAGRLAYE